MKRILLYSMIFLSFLGCKKEESASSSDNLIQPLAIGNYWQFIDSSFSDNGSFIKVDTSKLMIPDTVHVIFQGMEMILYKWNWSTALETSWLCKNDQDGFCFYGGISNSGTYIFGKSIDRKYPVNVNEKWELCRYSYSKIHDSTFFFINDTISRECTSINEPFVTKTGTLSCYKYHYSTFNGNTTTETYLFNHLNIGYVGLVSMRNNIVIYKKTLLTYKVK